MDGVGSEVLAPKMQYVVSRGYRMYPQSPVFIVICCVRSFHAVSSSVLVVVDWLDSLFMRDIARSMYRIRRDQ
jgi:hypothetical protein